MRFLKDETIYLTPLSPVHIGFDQTYDPSTYVVKGQKLYHFNPLTVELPDAVRKMLTVGVCKDLQSLTRFLHEHADDFLPWADLIVPIDRYCAQQIVNMRTSKRGASRWDCYRMMCNCDGSATTAYIPGSSIKGAIKTALETRLGKQLVGEPLQSPMRFLKVADFTSGGRYVKVACECASRYYKNKPNHDPCKIKSYFESVRPGQYRIFSGAFVLTDKTNRNNIPNAYTEVKTVMSDLHRYSIRLWNKEKLLYKLADAAWVESVEKLLAKFAGEIRDGRMCLLRLGKNSGAEGKTIPKLASITLRHRSGFEENKPETTTMWLTGDSDSNPSLHGLPYGWVLCEAPVNKTDNQVLAQWCKEFKDTFNSIDVQKELEQMAAQRQAVRDRKAAIEKENAQIQARRDEEARRETEFQNRLSAMSDEEKKVAELCKKLEQGTGPIMPQDGLMRETIELLQEAVSWTDGAVRKQTADLIEPIARKRKMFETKKKVLKPLFAQLRGQQ